MLLFVRSPDLDRIWPFVQARALERFESLGEARVIELERGVPVSEHADLSNVQAIALFGGALTDACVERAPNLRVVGCNTDNTGRGLPLEALRAAGVPVIDTTRAWGQSVAETALALALAGLRRVPQWHAEVARGERSWVYEAQQYCDATGFANGELGSRHVGVVGLGQIGGRVARWCAALAQDAGASISAPAEGGGHGSRVMGYDPYLPDGVAERWGVQRTDMDTLVERSEVVFITVPPTPTARHLLNRERIERLRQGALVVVVTRAHAVDMTALRERIVRNEVAGAFDVYDVEPLPVDDPLRGRANVVHTPHIAGRTRDANIRTADILADDFTRVLSGKAPQHELTAQAIQVRMGEREQ